MGFGARFDARGFVLAFLAAFELGTIFLIALRFVDGRLERFRE
jgi:hypothetical protein